MRPLGARGAAYVRRRVEERRVTCARPTAAIIERTAAEYLTCIKDRLDIVEALLSICQTCLPARRRLDARIDSTVRRLGIAPTSDACVTRGLFALVRRTSLVSPRQRPAAAIVSDLPQPCRHARRHSLPVRDGQL